MEIPLGSKVRDITSGFEGIVTSRTEQLNGCIQYYVEPPVDKKTGELGKGWSIDVESLKVISGGVVKELDANRLKMKKVVPIAMQATGGAKTQKLDAKPS